VHDVDIPENDATPRPRGSRRRLNFLEPEEEDTSQDMDIDVEAPVL
jgi:hypothetical protein